MEIQSSTNERAAPHAQRTTSQEDSVPSVGAEDSQQRADINKGSATSPNSANPSPDSSTILDNGDIEKAIQTSDNGTQVATSRSDLVEFDGPNDPDNPKNWSKRKRWIITAAGSAMTWGVTFSSSIFSVAINPIAKEYHIGTVTSTLTLFGRIPVAVAQNVETIMLGRFFGGFAASSPLATVGGLMSDIWLPIERAYAICCFASGGFAGPVVGPVVGGFLVDSHLGWRWTAWITLILASAIGIFGFFAIPETSAPRILQLRARRLRFETGNWALHAKADENPITARTILTVYLVRPFVMIVQEPILALVTAYMSFIYGVLYLLFEAYPVSFQEERGWSPGIGSLPFLPFLVGIALGACGIAYSTRTNFTRAYVKHGKIIPEERLPPMIIGAIVLPIGLFWYAWTSSPHITWVPQVISSAALGGGTMVAFWQGVNYIIDCYGFYSNSAISANTFIRSIFGAAFPLFAHDMYTKIGVAWATSILGFVCVLFTPVPILFYYYGAKIRAKSRFAPTK